MKTTLVPVGGGDTDKAVFETALAVARTLTGHLEFLHICMGASDAAPAHARAVVRRLHANRDRRRRAAGVHGALIRCCFDPDQGRIAACWGKLAGAVCTAFKCFGPLP